MHKHLQKIDARKAIGISLDRHPRKNQRTYVPQPGLFDTPAPITIRLAPMQEGLMDAGKGSPPKKKLSKAAEQAKNRREKLNAWRGIVEKQLCPYPEKQEMLKNSQEKKNLDYQLSQVLEHYSHELGINLAILKGYRKADAIADIAKDGMDEFRLTAMQKLAGGLFLDARSSSSADDLRNAGELVMLVAMLRDTCRMQSMLSRGEIVAPVREYFGELEKKKRRGAKSAENLLSDHALCSAFQSYAKKAREIAEGKKELAQA